MAWCMIDFSTDSLPAQRLSLTLLTGALMEAVFLQQKTILTEAELKDQGLGDIDESADDLMAQLAALNAS